MSEHQRSHRRFLPTYATLVGLPALALFIILRVGDSVIGKNAVAVTKAAASPAGPAAPATTSATAFDLPLLLLFATLTIMPISRVGRWLLRLIGRGHA